MRFWKRKGNGGDAEVGVRVYMDYAAATPVDDEAFSSMQPYFSEHFGNPGSTHAEGQTGKHAVTSSRESIARALGAHADEIVFTSGGTEANNTAVLGTFANESAVHVVTTAIEHPSVLEPVRGLRERGARVTEVGIDAEGRVNPKDIARALTPDTLLVSVMYVNNEVGSIQPIRDIAKVIRAHRKETGKRTPFLHTDASQAPLFLPLSIDTLGVDLLTLDAQKLYGPKGIGLLYRRRGVEIASMMLGGDQEHGLRPGTENVPLIVGFAKALELAEARREKDNEHLTELRDYFFSEVARCVPHAVVNGGMEHRAPNNVNISIPGLESAFMVAWLDARGIACGARSACTSEEDEPSYVIRALGGNAERAQSSLRFTLGRKNTKEDIDRTVRVLTEMVERLTEHK